MCLLSCKIQPKWLVKQERRSCLQPGTWGEQMIQGDLFSSRDISPSAELPCVYIMLSSVFPGSCGSINILAYKATLAANSLRTRVVSVQG